MITASVEAIVICLFVFEVVVGLIVVAVVVIATTLADIVVVPAFTVVVFACGLVVVVIRVVADLIEVAVKLEPCKVTSATDKKLVELQHCLTYV